MVAKSMVDQVVKNIREMIGTDQLSVGQKLPSEAELMRRYGVGRSTVREALRLLQAQGYVEIRPNAGAFLFSKNPDDQRAIAWIAEHREEVIDVMRIRMALEGLAARMAAERAMDNEVYCLVGIQTLMEQAAEQSDTMKLALYDEAFHESIAKSTHSPLMTNMVQQIASASANFRGKTFLVNRGYQACAAHAAILEAIRARDADLAEEAMRSHMQVNMEMARAYNE